MEQLLGIINQTLSFDHKRNNAGETRTADDDDQDMTSEDDTSPLVTLTIDHLTSLSAEGVMMALRFDRLLRGWCGNSTDASGGKKKGSKKKSSGGRSLTFLGRSHSAGGAKLTSVLHASDNVLSMVSNLSEILKSVCNTYPRVHGLWVEYFDTILDLGGGDASSTQLLATVWAENVEKNLLNSTHERKGIVFKLVELLSVKLCSVHTDSNDQQHPFLIVLSPLFLRTLLNSVSSRSNYLHAQSKSTLETVIASVKSDMSENDQLAVVMQLLTHGSSRFDKITATSSVRGDILVGCMYMYVCVQKEKGAERGSNGARRAVRMVMMKV